MRARRGFTLVETLIALSLLGVAAAVMVAPLYQYARRINVIGQAQARNGIVAREAGRLLALPFDSLDGRAGCATVSRPPLPYRGCVTVTIVSPGQRRVTLVVAPSATTIKADTVVFDRLLPSSGNPFNLP